MSLPTPESVQKLQTALHDKAKKSPKFRFYALYDKVHRKDVLTFAYACSKANGGAAGVDGQTFEDIEAYGVERWLDELMQELKNQTYRPLPVRRVWIPKPDGKTQRPLGVPAIRDRVPMMAAVLVLDPIFEADLQPEQYAYRRDRSALDAVKHVHKLINTGHVEIVDADLASYFDSLPHAELLKSVARRVVDGAMLHLIKMWLTAPVEEMDERGKKHRNTLNRDEGRGSPQGSPISPLLSNLYMRRFVLGWKKLGHEPRLGASIVNYADDLVICCRGRGEEALAAMQVMMTKLKLTVRHYPMKAGETIEARLMHPIYVGEKLVVPENTPLRGHVVELKPDSKTRLHARLRGDFTPFHTARVEFDELMLPSGVLPISAVTADDGAPVLQLQAPGVSPGQSFISRRWTDAKRWLHEQVAYFTSPGKGDRALQLLYHQLPYHPQRIDTHTAWSFELTAPVELPTTPTVASGPPASAAPTSGNSEIWSVNATLSCGLTSATAKPGDPVEAQVVEPVYDHDKQLVVPQGSRLVGKVSIATAAKSFGRNGKLRFTFQQVRFPEGYNRSVEGALAGAATEKNQDLSLDAEGTITPRNKSSVIAPLLLTMLAGRALDEDGNLTLQTGGASNGFGLVGRIVGIAVGDRNLAAGLGYYAAALSVYDNFIQPGRDVVFPKDTRIEIETTPLRAPVLKPQGQ